MNRQRWKDLAEAIGFTAVIASLLFVGIETRNSTKQAELTTQALEISAYQALMSNIDDLNKVLLQNPDLAPMTADIWSSDPADPKNYEMRRILYILFRHGDLAYFMYERGAINKSRLDSALSPVPIYSEVGREFWGRSRQSFSPGYQAYIDEIINRQPTSNLSE
jgi:hypothetical protein